jgi:hypothetical protein
MKTQNTILKAINYLDIYAKRNANFNDFKYIGFISLKILRTRINLIYKLDCIIKLKGL